MDPAIISKATEGMEASPKSDVETQPLEIAELPGGRDVADIEYETSKPTNDREIGERLDGRDQADIEYETSKPTNDGDTNEVPPVDDESQEEDRGGDDIVTGAAFEKAEQYDHFLDDANPWHEELRTPLFHAQIIGFRWMLDRHYVGGGLVADKVGVGKVFTPRRPVANIDVQTYQTINFILALRDAFPAPRDRGLCLLVLSSSLLNTTWKRTMSNTGVPETKQFWQPGARALNVLDCTEWTKHRKVPTNAELSRIDVVMITSSMLAVLEDPWVVKVTWYTVVADEGHGYLRGQHNQKSTSYTIQKWHKLQLRTQSCFVLTGTPFVTKVSYDAVRMIEAIASPPVRAKWGVEYTTEALNVLFDGWNSEGRVEKAAQYAEVLAGCTLRRDHRSLIRGTPVIRDYIKECQLYEQPLASLPKEVLAREKFFEGYRGAARNKYGYIRCLGYTNLYMEWHAIVNSREAKQTKWQAFWESWDPQKLKEEIKTHVRLARVCQLLNQSKRRGDGVVVFSQRVFLAELMIRVCPLCSVFFLIFQVCQLLKLRVGFLGQKGKPVMGMPQKLTDQAETIRKCDDGELDVVVVMVQSGKVGLNLQSMNVMISLNPISQASEQEQAQGIYQIQGCNDNRALLPYGPEQTDEMV